jgi:ubiquinone biosynthesis protein UbiJ
MPTQTDTPSLEHLAAMLHELEANIERLAERLNRLERAFAR